MSYVLDVPTDKPGDYSVADALRIAKQNGIERLVHTDFGFIRVPRATLIELLERLRQSRQVAIQKEYKFAIFYFSLPA